MKEILDIVIASFLTTFILSPTIVALGSPFSRSLLKNVVVVGGTHGNEYTGVWCIKALNRTLGTINSQYPSLNISTLLANPQAHLENKRFIHNDLNRQFSSKAISEVNDDTLPQSVEALRALEINQLIGPKFSSTVTADVVIDLHTTTANMGVTVIIAQGDPVMAQAAAYVLKNSVDNVRCILHTHPNREIRPNLSSVARHGFTVEVGPVPQGVLRHDTVEKTQRVMYSLLEYLDKYNSNHGKLMQELKGRYEGMGFRIPCFRSFLSLKKGEMSGKIQWPSDDENPNFPAVMVHKDLQDRDFQKIETGDPLFVDLEGNTISYDGSHGTPVYLMFINEGGYYYKSSGTGIAVAVPAEFDMQTGKVVEDCVANIDRL